MNDWIDRADAVLVAWYPGREGGNAITQAIFGDYNPGASSHLPSIRLRGRFR